MSFVVGSLHFSEILYSERGRERAGRRGKSTYNFGLLKNRRSLVDWLILKWVSIFFVVFSCCSGCIIALYLNKQN